MREVLWEFVNEGDLGFLEGDGSKMRESWQLCNSVTTVSGSRFPKLYSLHSCIPSFARI